MKKLSLIISFILIFAGCSHSNTDVQRLQTEEPPATPATLNQLSNVEITSSPDAINTIEPTIPTPERPRIILFIGDGMGSAHRLAGQYYSVGEVRELAMDALPVSGWLITDSIDGVLTESAAAATALATGQKTYNGVISLDPHGNQLKTILEYAQDRGMSVGLVSTKFITDATTAAFGAHVENNSMGPEVASQLLEHRVDVIFGGGENDFLPIDVEGCHPGPGNRTDERNLIQEAENSGYTFICDEQSFNQLDPLTDPLVIGLFADENMIRPYSPSLADMTKTAIETLSPNPNGFFLVVEGAMIDIASHYQQSKNVFEDIVGLDQAVQVAMEYAEFDEDMLIIVTADHETGGLKVDLYSTGSSYEVGPFHMPNGTEFFLSWTTGSHTNVDVPVTAFGPGAEKLSGINENTIVFDVMLEFLGISGNQE